MEIGYIIKNLRKEKKLTQEELAKELQVSTQAVSKWECGGSPDLELIPKIAKFFNVTTDYLFDIKDNKFYGINKTIGEYINSFENEETKIDKMLELSWYMLINSNDIFDIDDDYNKVLNRNECHSLLSLDSGIVLSSLLKDKRFSFVIPTSKEGNYKQFLETKEQQIKLCKALGEKDFYDSLIYIYSKEQKSFTEKLLVKNIGITETRAKEIIASLQEFNLLFTNEVELNDEIIKVYSLYENVALIGLLANLDMIVNRPQNFYCYLGNKHDKFF